MTDKIVQLVDKDNNNIYPVTTADAPTITVTSVDPGEGVSLAANHFIAVYGEDQDSYSTNEMETNAKWIDGKTIYKKTVNFGALPNATSKQVAHGITNLYRVIEIVGWAYRSGDGTSFPLPATSASATGAITVTATATDINVSTGTDRSNIAESYITLYYTKSA